MISWFVKIIILLLFLALALSNMQTVDFYYLPAQGVHVPLIVIMFGMFVVGAVFGMFAMFGRILRLRSENNRLRNEVEKTARLTTQDISAPTPTAINVKK